MTSRQGRVRRVGLDRARFRDGLTGQGAPIHRQAVGSGEAQIGRHDVADPKQDDVTGHEPGGPRLDHRAVAADPGGRGACLAQRIEGAVGAVLGHDVGPDDRAGREQDQDPVADLAEQDRQDAGGDEHQQERFGDGLEDHPKDGRPLGGFEFVGTGDRRTSFDLGAREAGRRVHVEGARDG